MKVRDGKEYTVHHLYWERYFKDNPEILKERQLVNTKNAKPAGNKPMNTRRIYDMVTTGEKRWAYAAVFAMISGLVAIKITFT